MTSRTFRTWNNPFFTTGTTYKAITKTNQVPQGFWLLGEKACDLEFVDAVRSEAGNIWQNHFWANFPVFFLVGQLPIRFFGLTMFNPFLLEVWPFFSAGKANFYGLEGETGQLPVPRIMEYVRRPERISLALWAAESPIATFWGPSFF